MDDMNLTSKEKKAIKELRGALRSLPSKLVLSVDEEARIIVSKAGVPMAEYREAVSDTGRVVERRQ